MPVFVAFLRGINVGGHRKVPMAELRGLCAAQLGHKGVRSYIASGNLVFVAEGTAEKIARDLTDLIKQHFGFDVPVLVFDRAALEAVLASCPFPLDSGKAVHGFLCFDPPQLDMAQVDNLRAANEELVVTGQTIWLLAPDGIGRSKLAEKLNPKVEVTARNLNTLLKMVELARATD